MSKHKLIFFVFVMMFSNACSPKEQALIDIPLEGKWEFRQVGSGQWMPATVPGTVHTDLMAAGIIEDPYYRLNELDVQWVDKEDWEYRTTFQLNSSFIQNRNQQLIFNGLDTYADVYVNDSLLLSANNMFRTWSVDISGVAQEGSNTLRVLFHSPIKIGLELLHASPYPYPAGNDQSERGGLGNDKVSVFTRKAPYHYGWDWGPRLVTSGVWRPVSLRSWSGVHVESVYIVQNEVTADNAKLFALADVRSDRHQTLKMVVKEGKKVLAERMIHLEPNDNLARVPFEISKPRLWWSRGLGEPNLYRFTVELYEADNKVASGNVVTGLRSVKLVRQPDDKGESFYFELNGKPVFAKGANVIPSDLFLPRVTRSRYEKMVSDASDANMNMLRIWGGGIYEDDYFYQLCDEKGIMVWQDFMFACSMYPSDDEFITNIRQEAVDNVIRLRNHPSIVLWCGNNEIDEAWKHDIPRGGWGWKKHYTDQQQEEIFNGYLKIFHDELAKVVDHYVVGVDYWPSSPMSGPEPNEHSSQDATSGDIHYWGVWHGLHPIEAYNKHIGRFMSEYGFQSFPDFETVETYTLPEDYDIESEVMMSHQRSGIGNIRIREYLGRDYRVPNDFEKFLYMSQVLQARAMKTAVEAHRRAMPYCMGSLYWQLNDCWQVASWSGIDYFHKWKATHYALREAFDPLLLAFEPSEDSVKIVVVSDSQQDASFDLVVKVVGFDGELIFQNKKRVTVKANTATPIFDASLDVLLSSHAKESVFVKAELLQRNHMVTQSLHYLVKPKELALPKGKIEWHVFVDGKGFGVSLTSKHLVKDLYISLPGKNTHFSNNYFDLLPGEEHIIKFECDKTKEWIDNNLKLMHLQDAMN